MAKLANATDVQNYFDRLCQNQATENPVISSADRTVFLEEAYLAIAAHNHHRLVYSANTQWTDLDLTKTISLTDGAWIRVTSVEWTKQNTSTGWLPVRLSSWETVRLMQATHVDNAGDHSYAQFSQTPMRGPSMAGIKPVLTLPGRTDYSVALFPNNYPGTFSYIRLVGHLWTNPNEAIPWDMDEVSLRYVAHLAAARASATFGRSPDFVQALLTGLPEWLLDEYGLTVYSQAKDSFDPGMALGRSEGQR